MNTVVSTIASADIRNAKHRRKELTRTLAWLKTRINWESDPITQRFITEIEEELALLKKRSGLGQTWRIQHTRGSYD
jgi:hypothetical protein